MKDELEGYGDAHSMNETTMLWVIGKAEGIVDERQIKEARAALNRVKEWAALGERGTAAAIVERHHLCSCINRLGDVIRNKPALDVGRKSLMKSDEGNRIKAMEADKRKKKWQAMADKLWAKPLNANKSANVIAKLIARETGDKPDTIRKAIKKLA
jgi:hypothetical protein